MKKIILGTLLGFILCVGAWFVTTIDHSCELIDYKTAFFTIKNKSDYKVTKVTLKHSYGELFISDIEINETAYLGFQNTGENGYTLIVELENDSILQSNGMYFEYGLRTTETITNSEIIQRNNW
ncbi:MAG: hypothetical protein ACQERC_11460 [Bacteroidota bacterium]